MPGTNNFLTQIRLSLHIVASLNIPMPFLCISWHCPSLPLHIGAAHPPARPRLTFSFRSVPIQCLSITLRGIPLRFRCRSALRFAPLSHCEPVHRLAVPCPCNATPRTSMPFQCIANQHVASPFLCITRPFDTVLCRCYSLLRLALLRHCSARPHYTLCRCVATLCPS